MSDELHVVEPTNVDIPKVETPAPKLLTKVERLDLLEINLLDERITHVETTQRGLVTEGQRLEMIKLKLNEERDVIVKMMVSKYQLGPNDKYNRESGNITRG